LLADQAFNDKGATTAALFKLSLGESTVCPVLHYSTLFPPIAEPSVRLKSPPRHRGEEHLGPEYDILTTPIPAAPG
jgi:hypothetical protein